MDARASLGLPLCLLEVTYAHILSVPFHSLAFAEFIFWQRLITSDQGKKTHMNKRSVS